MYLLKHLGSLGCTEEVVLSTVHLSAWHKHSFFFSQKEARKKKERYPGSE